MSQGSQADAIVLGGGPAGMVTATLMAEDGWRVCLVDGLPGGGRTMLMESVHDLPGAGAEITGPDLAGRLLERTMDAGVGVVAEAARAITLGPATHTIDVGDSSLTAPVVVIATGTSDGRLGLEGEGRFIGHGISRCASCDAPLFAGDDVMLAGNGDWAVEEVLILARYARAVTVAVPDERLSCSRARWRRLSACDNVEVLTSTRIVGLVAEVDNMLASVRLSQAGRQWTAPARAVIPLIGQRPNTDIVPAEAARDPSGYLLTHATATNVAGLYAAGDVTRATHQTVGSAFADAVVAARAASAYLVER